MERTAVLITLRRGPCLRKSWRAYKLLSCSPCLPAEWIPFSLSSLSSLSSSLWPRIHSVVSADIKVHPRRPTVPRAPPRFWIPPCYSFEPKPTRKSPQACVRRPARPDQPHRSIGASALPLPGRYRDARRCRLRAPAFRFALRHPRIDIVGMDISKPSQHGGEADQSALQGRAPPDGPG